MKPTIIKAAAIQLDTRIGDTWHNLNACQQMAEQALAAGATWIALPEFFNTGVNFDPKSNLVDKIESQNGSSAQFLQNFSAKHNVVIGGSFMCRLYNPDGSKAGVRNRYLCFNKGELVGQHDKDLPTMWEAAFYEGSDAGDTGELGSVNNQGEDIRIGSAVCWEFLRTQTSRRLRGKIDVLIGGSHWWSIPENWPKFIMRKMAEDNSHNFITAVRETARLTGVPVIHASHCAMFESKFPSVPLLKYRGQLEGHAAIIDAEGNILAHRSKEEGEGFIISEVEVGYNSSQEKIPDTFWLRKRGLLPTYSWIADGFMGKRWYYKNVFGK